MNDKCIKDLDCHHIYKQLIPRGLYNLVNKLHNFIIITLMNCTMLGTYVIVKMFDGRKAYVVVVEYCKMLPK